MEKQNIKYHIDNYMHEFNRAVYHPILNRDIGQPNLDETTAFILLLPKLNGEEWTESMNTAAIAVGAVYAAFDAHDTIDADDATTTQQQLTVLSGDYLSGVYYKVLAAVADFEFINVLSKAIGQINEVKTDFYYKSTSDLKTNLDAIKIIKAECTIRFLQTFGFDKYIPLAAAALPLLSMDPVLGEDFEQVVPIAKGWVIPSSQADQAIAELRMDMHQAITEASFIAPFLKEEIRGRTTPLLGKMI